LSDDPDYITVNHACRIVGGHEKPISAATYYRGVKAGRLPAPEHPTPGVSRIAMLRERGKVEPRDWIAHLNKIAATEIDRVALATKRKQWPRDLVGSESRPGSMQMDAKLRDAILDAELLAATTHAEPLSEDGSRLEFYDDGYPKLPECLRRKQPS
jgi:hypothetical protein